MFRITDIEKEILDLSLKKRIEQKFGKDKGKQIIKCIKKCLAEGKKDEELKNCVKQCVLETEETEERATEVSNLLFYSFIFVG